MIIFVVLFLVLCCPIAIVLWTIGVDITIILLGYLAINAAVLALYIIIKFVQRKIIYIADVNKNDKWLIDEFKRCNVIVDGKKGSGKDLLFAHVIYMRGEQHYSNIPYNYITEVIEVKELNVGNNTFENFINGNIEKFNPRFSEGSDIYISDGGLYLPCHEDKLLDRLYPSMPIFYALQRQLYDSNTHFNVQWLGRMWKKVREQADSYIRIIKSKDMGDYFLTTARCYENYRSAELNLLPNSNEQFKATHGIITQRNFKINKSELDYDTRHFKKILLNASLSFYGDNEIKSLEKVVNKIEKKTNQIFDQAD